VHDFHGEFGPFRFRRQLRRLQVPLSSFVDGIEIQLTRPGREDSTEALMN